MTDLEQTIVFDTLKSIQQHAPLLCKLLNERATAEESDAYKTGVYSAVIRLSALFKHGEMEAHEERHRKIKEDLDAYFAQRDNDQGMARKALPSPPCSALPEERGSDALR